MYTQIHWADPLFQKTHVHYKMQYSVFIFLSIAYLPLDPLSSPAIHRHFTVTKCHRKVTNRKIWVSNTHYCTSSIQSIPKHSVPDLLLNLNVFQSSPHWMTDISWSLPVMRCCPWGVRELGLICEIVLVPSKHSVYPQSDVINIFTIREG